jgi:hypothetical protein
MVLCLKVLISDLGGFLPYQQTSIIQKQNVRLGFMKQNLIWTQILKKTRLDSQRQEQGWTRIFGPG